MPRRPDGRCPACRRESEKRAHAKYDRTPNGKALKKLARKRYLATEKGKAFLVNVRGRNKAKRSAYEHERGLRRYGLNLDTYQHILTQQKGACAICKSTDPGHGKRRLAVDHNHKNGQIRGLLCNTCNKGLGIFKDNPVLMRAAIFYLCSNNT